MEVKELEKDLINRANNNSMFGKRGDISAGNYKSYVDNILSWDIPDTKKQKILDKLYEKYSEILKLEAQWVSVAVAGPANYNSKKLEKSDPILQKSHDLHIWFQNLQKQVKGSKVDTTKRKIELIMDKINFCDERGFDPRDHLIELAYLDNNKFLELYDKYYPKFKWRKNSIIFKVYAQSLNGEIEEIKKKIIYKDENFTAYIQGDRAYIKFPMKVQQQLIYALKKRGWWWNSHEKAWSTYLKRVDKPWISSISTKYAQYL